MRSALREPPGGPRRCRVSRRRNSQVMDFGRRTGRRCALRPTGPFASVRDRWGFTHGGLMTAVTELAAPLPDIKVSVRQTFGFDSDMEVPAYAESDEHVPDIDSDYRFDRPTTLAILAGFARNRRVIVTGYHGTGKSTHIEQVAARRNWPCVRVKLDSRT